MQDAALFDPLSEILERSKLPPFSWSEYFIYDVWLFGENKKTDILVLGINPAGSCNRRFETEPILKVTGEVDERNKESKSTRKWREKIKRMFSDFSVRQSEFFFWSTPDTKDENFKDHFGDKPTSTKILSICKNINQGMIKIRNPNLG